MPLLGALGMELFGDARERLHQSALAGHGRERAAVIDITRADGYRLGHGAVRGVGRVRDDRRGDESMDPRSRKHPVVGAGRWRTMLKITLPLVAPGVLGAAIFVFAEMLGSFSAALVLGTPARFYVITTAIYQFVSQYPPRLPLAAAMGVSLFAVMFLMLYLYRRITANRSFVTISGKAFRPRTWTLAAALGSVRGLRSLLSFRWCCRSPR